MSTPEFQFFRVGPGYIDHWSHETEHWLIDKNKRLASRELKESFYRLIEKRNVLQSARQAFGTASSIAQPKRPSDKDQQTLFTATQDFFLTYYTTLSALAGFFVRFQYILGDVPHRSNEKFIKWLEKRSLHHEVVVPLLRSAREFRTILDHKADLPPYDWSTVVTNGIVLVALHGANKSSGEPPEGAVSCSPKDVMQQEIELDADWIFIAPDEEMVLTSLALQMNTIFPIITAKVASLESLYGCRWVPTLGEDEPREGYPIFAADEGTVIESGAPKPGAAFGL